MSKALDILITGGSGQVGLELSRLDWPPEIVPHFPDRSQLDMASEASVRACLASREWAGLINCAAYTAVDKAEEDVGTAFLINAQAPAWLAEISKDLNIPLLHVSTDYVFDGQKAEAYLENDPVGPMNVYGASKLAGELAVRSGNPRSVILRTAWVLSAHRANFLKTMIRLASVHSELRVVDDQIGCPTSATDIAEALQAIMIQCLANANATFGVFHFVNAGQASWCELARTIFAWSDECGGPTAQVSAIGTADYPTPARRPANSRLSTARFEAAFGMKPRPWQEAVRAILAHHLDMTR